MPNNSFAEREAQRLLALRDLKILDTPPEAAYERVTALAAQLFEVPVSLVSLVDESRQWFKSCFGGDLIGTRETGRDVAFCAHAIEADAVLVVPDATLDARFADNPLVTGAPHIRFYAGAPLRSPEGFAIGTLCLIDFVPREFSEKERVQLHALAEIVSNELKHRRDAQEAQSSEHRLRTLIENTSDIISILDAQGIILYESPAVTELLGYTPEELLGQSAFSLVHPDDHAVLGEAFQRVAGGEQQVEPVEFRFLHRDGSWRVLEAIGRSRLDDPDLGGIVVSSRDVTARRAAQRILRESEENLRLALDAGQMGVWKADLATNKIQWSPRLEKIHGLAAGGIASFAQFLRCIHPEDRALVKRCAAQAIETGRDFITEYRALRPDGSVCWLEARGVPVQGGDGEVATLAGVSSDISERKAVEDERQRSAQRIANLLESITDAFFSVDKNWRFTYINDQAEKLLARRREELLGRDLWEEFPDSADSIFQREYSRAIETGKPVEFEHFYEALNVWLEFHVYPSNEGLSIYFRDVTARHNARRALQEARDEAVRHRENAERANAAKSEFLSRMSHELRTPLNAILGFGQLLETSELTPEDRESIEQIMLAGGHLLHLINEVLDIARIEAGRMKLSLEPVSVREVCDEACSLIRPVASQRDLALHNETENCELYVQADAQRFKQVMLNLLSNAVKYNRDAGTLTVSCEEDAVGRLRICVTDSGNGLTPDEIQRLFRPFERLDADSSDTQGTGIGLILSRRLAEAMGGTLDLKSTPGQGSTFWLELPLAHQSRPEPLHTTAESADDLLHHTVLYIEEGTANLQLVELLLLQRNNLALLAAPSGLEGLQMAQAQSPDLVLLDLPLPEIDGKDVLRRLRTTASTRDIPVVILSAESAPEQIERWKKDGAHGYLAKPFSAKEFSRMLATHLPEESLPELAGGTIS